MSDAQIGGRAVRDRIFTNLLASAYSLQQRQDRLRARVSASKSNELISAVLETQGLVWHHAIHPETAMDLIASRSQKLCGAAGAAIALVRGENLEYKIAIGIAAGMLGSKILADSSFSFQQLKSQPFIESSTWRDRALGTRVTSSSVLSIPIQRKGTLAGCIQLFSRLGQFGEESVYTCELMSSILTQLLDETEFHGNGQEEGAINKNAVASVESDSNSPNVRSQRSDENLRESSKDKQQTLNSSDSLPGSPNRDAPIRSALSTSRNINALAHNGASGVRPAHAGVRAKTMAYPIVVLVFLVLANYFGSVQGWGFELASIAIIVFTTVELFKRW